MAVDTANASELAQIAGELGADVFSGDLRYPSSTGGGVAIGASPQPPVLAMIRV